VNAGPAQLRAVLTGLAGHAATEEELLLAAAPAGEEGSPQRWAAVPLIAHNTEFKRQQAIRLAAVAAGTVPPGFGDIDHGSDEVYRRCAAQPAGAVAADSRQATADLLDGLAAVSDADLTDPARHPWLAGRQLWLQVVVRAFWHPMGHLGDYYADHGQPDRAAAMAAHAVAAARYLDAPPAARGMAFYNLACAQARSDRPDAALVPLRRAIRLNRALTVNAARDRDLAVLRERGQLDELLAR
jgi:hypothetical protein